MGYLIDIVVGTAGSLLAAEIYCRADPVSRGWIRRAVARLPAEQRALREEEWFAHLQETPGAVGKLLHGIGCWSGAPAVARAAGVRVQQARSASAVWKAALNERVP